MDPKNLHIPQYDPKKSERMKLDGKFGERVFHASVTEYLSTNPTLRFGGIYLDLCGSYTGQLKPALEEFFRKDRIHPEGIVFAMTWTHRDVESKLFETIFELLDLFRRQAHRINMIVADQKRVDYVPMHVLFVSLVSM